MKISQENRGIKSGLVEVLKGALPGIAAGLILLGSYIGFNSYINRTPKAEPKAPTPIEQSCDQSNPDYPSMSTAGGDEYTECREIRDQIPITEKTDLIFRGDNMFDFDFPQYTPKTNVPELRGAPEKPTPEYNQPNYDRKSPVKRYVGNKLVNRKVKNNNPLNIKVVYHYDKKGRRIIIPWAGQVGVDPRGFAILKNEVYGLRSWLKNAGDLRDKYGTDTVSELITRCSPPHENDTNGYINFVAQNLGVSPDEKIDFTNKEQTVSLLALVAQKESSAQYPRQTLEKAYAMLYR